VTSSPDHPPRRGRARWFRATSASSIGIEIVVAVLLGTYGGHLLEKHVTHWSPWTMLLGLLLGCAAAGKAIARTIREHEKAVAEAPPGGEGD
jgi:F0F1-type ATP synthase assembly protein I